MWKKSNTKSGLTITVSSLICLQVVAAMAAGYRNNSSLNNVGSNGYYWSSSLNEDNAQNAWYLNFNSSNQNLNNNNRSNGYSVRPV